MNGQTYKEINDLHHRAKVSTLMEDAYGRWWNVPPEKGTKFYDFLQLPPIVQIMNMGLSSMDALFNISMKDKRFAPHAFLLGVEILAAERQKTNDGSSGEDGEWQGGGAKRRAYLEYGLERSWILLEQFLALVEEEEEEERLKSAGV